MELFFGNCGGKSMKAQQVGKKEYGFTRTVDISFDDATERVREALKGEGFGVLSEIRLDEKLKEKLGVEFRRYVILGACNPPLAYKTLQEDINIGLLLPCNVIVYEADDKNKSVVAAVDAQAMLSVVGENSAMNEVATEVNERLRRVIEQV
ncbi:MAG: DUF302 domain-containing protein [Acidobacteriota bacterium]